MELPTLLIFIVIVFVGSYVQSVAGFAMGMIIVAVVGGLQIIDLPTLTAVVSILSIFNVVLALRGQFHQVDRKLATWLALGQVPAIFVGVFVMQWLDGNTRWLLEVCLGVFITIGGLSMFIRPNPWPRVSGPLASVSTGVIGGLVGGMFSASGPVLGWFGYNQPLPVAIIRATLLTCFFVTTSTRTVVVGFTGGLTETVLVTAALGLPAVIVGTWMGKNLPPPVAEAGIKRGAYLLLLIMGTWILINALLQRT